MLPSLKSKSLLLFNTTLPLCQLVLLSPFGFSIISTSAGHILQRQKRRAPNSFELQRSPPPCSSCLSRQVLLSAKNSEISSLLLEIRRLNHLNNDLLAKEEDRPNIIPRGLAIAAQRLKTLPDVFSCLDTWCKYDDQKFLEHMDAFGAGELVHALQDIILRTFKLLHPLDPSPSQQFLAPKVSRMCSILFDAIMKPGQYQSVSSWAWALLVKLQCKSSKTVEYSWRRISATADDGKFWSYDRLEEKDPKHAVHNILAESKKRAMDYVGYFATTGGKMKPVEASLLIPCSFLTGKKKSVVVSES